MRTHRVIGSPGVSFGHQQRAAVTVSGYLFLRQKENAKKEGRKRKKMKEREKERETGENEKGYRGERTKSVRETEISPASVFAVSRFNLIIRAS